MAPKAHSMSLLFHPKKKQQQRQNNGAGSQPRDPSKQASPQKPRPSPASTSTATASADDEELFKLPNTPYSEFRILSSALQGWKYDVMKFDSRKPVDIMRWSPPIKLNRKDLRKDDPANSVVAVPQAVGPMLGPDGKAVIGADGKMVMVDAEGKPIHGENHHQYGGYRNNNNSAGASGSGTGAAGGKDKGKGAAPGGRKRFQKKTRQVFLVPDEVRQLRREERYPWVMEDSSANKNESWVGHLEEVSKAETHGFFMPAANDAFKFVPAHRWYKFQKKLKHDLPTDTANVESLYTQSQKKDPQAWLATFNGGRGASAATAAMFKQEAEGKPNINEGQSLGPGGRKLKTVDSGADRLFGEDDEDGGARKRREKELGEDGDMDEQVYEEDFADDEETMNVDENDEEAKEIEERLKREYQRANKQNETGLDEDEEEDESPKNKQTKAMEKMILKNEGNPAYESDEEKNPYASSEEEEEEPEPVQTGPAIQPQPQQIDPKATAPKPAAPKIQTTSNSRATSPAIASPSLGGHSLVAKRATSPKVPKAKNPGASSRTNSPSGSRANSPTPSRATSPLANGVINESQKSNKRKADDSPTSPSSNGGPNSGALPKPKKKKMQAAGPVNSISSAELEALLIHWLKTTPNATTRDCIQHFNSYLVDQEKKTEFSTMVKGVALLKNGVLGLRPGLG